MLALVLGMASVAVAVAAVEAVRARTAERSIRWWIVLVAGVSGAALLWLWWSYLRFPLVQPIV